MAALSIIEAMATVLWCYAGLSLAAWGIRIARLDHGQQIPAVTDLLGHLVPAMILLVLTILAGALLGFVSTVVFIALLFPAGLAYGAHMALNGVEPPPTSFHTLTRAMASLVLAAGLVYLRQVA